MKNYINFLVGLIPKQSKLPCIVGFLLGVIGAFLFVLYTQPKFMIHFFENKYYEENLKLKSDNIILKNELNNINYKFDIISKINKNYDVELSKYKKNNIKSYAVAKIDEMVYIFDSVGIVLDGVSSDMYFINIRLFIGGSFTNKITLNLNKDVYKYEIGEYDCTTIYTNLIDNFSGGISSSCTKK